MVAAKIKTLVNAICYSVSSAIIIDTEGEVNRYRLIVTNRGSTMIDHTYPTLRGAKIAFSKLFKDQGCKKSIKAEWSRFFPPEREKINAKFNSKGSTVQGSLPVEHG